MHPFFFLAGLMMGLLHATVLSIIAFFVLFAASRSQGLLKTIGNLLGAWLFILAVLALVGGALMSSFGGPWGGHMMGHYPHPWMQPGHPVVTQPPAAPAT
ncbi:MAG: hypothetical protein ACHP7N_15780, partial [Caulobacterales bacterium]